LETFTALNLSPSIPPIGLKKVAKAMNTPDRIPASTLPNYLVNNFGIDKVDAGIRSGVFIALATFLRPIGGSIKFISKYTANWS
jgi:hypothetical protein